MFATTNRPCRILAIGVAAACALLAAGNAMAAKTVGPMYDLQLPLPPVAIVQSATEEFDGDTWYVVTDTNGIEWDPELFFDDEEFRFVRGVSYATSDKGDFAHGYARVTTIFGRDLDPANGQDLKLTGYTQSAPEVQFSAQTVFGKSGRSYPTDGGKLVAIEDLPAVLGKGFDLTPFQGDPKSAVWVFTTTIPGKDLGVPTKGALFGDSFANTIPGAGDAAGGAYLPGTLPGTGLAVTNGTVDVLGARNGANGTCPWDSSANCIGLGGAAGSGALAGIMPYNLDPRYTYTIQMTVGLPDGAANQDFSVGLGNFSQPVTATSTPRQVDLTYTPSTVEPSAILNLAANSGQAHAPLLGALTLCAHPVGTKKLACSAPK